MSKNIFTDSLKIFTKKTPGTAWQCKYVLHVQEHIYRFTENIYKLIFRENKFHRKENKYGNLFYVLTGAS